MLLIENLKLLKSKEKLPLISAWGNNHHIWMYFFAFFNYSCFHHLFLKMFKLTGKLKE